jgi:outer membrane receptor protein involved in Fe transport
MIVQDMKRCRVFGVSLLAMMAASGAVPTLAMAQAAPAGSPPAQTETAGGKGNTLDLTTVIITGTSHASTKMKSSVSVSTLSSDQIVASQPQNASDALTSIPGIFVQSSGGGGNANVSVRGLPISAGGSRYMQFQEDGLPVLLFGDIAFGNPDDFIRMDTTVDHVEAVRGGTGSTLTTNGPGGIINFISRTGKVDGGSIGVTTGLGYQDERLDFNYGGHISDRTHYFLGGYYEDGTGPRTENTADIQGGQIKGNITQDLDNGYVRLNFKVLSDRQPMYMPAPVSISNGVIHTIAGIDPRTYTGYSANMPVDTVLNNNNTLSTIDLNKGMVTHANAIGFETHLNLGGGWTLDDKARAESNSGQWAAFYPGSAVAAAPSDARYANGANAGTAYGGLALTNVVFDVNVKNLGNATNDLKLTRTVKDLGGGDLTFGAGLFNNTQDVDLVWNFNAYLTTATSKPAPLNSASSGITTYGFEGPGFGNCCSRDYEGSYVTTAPYLFATYDLGALSLDGSLREDYQKATGYYNIATVPSGAAATTYASYAPANAVPIDYRLHHLEYSFGANYLITPDVAVFARYSDGAAFNADRIMDIGPLSGNAYIPLNVVTQAEGGVKARFGAFSAFVTLFDAKASEFNYSSVFTNAATSKYEGKGVELESSYHTGGFHVNLGLTYTDSKVLASGNTSLVGQPENRQPKVSYNLGAGYSASRFDAGLEFVGASSSTETDNAAPNNKLPAYMLVNGHFDYHLTPDTVVSLGGYNLFNKLAYTELDGTTSARALNGRTVKLSLKYSFQ